MALRTRLEPLALLALLHELEAAARRVRVRGVRFGPRTLDLDILLFDDAVLDLPGLVVPHPRLVERRFALEPLLELAPDAALPDGTRLAPVCAALPDQGVERLVERLDATMCPARPRPSPHHRGVTHVSHLEDLEEYDAELELALKREYKTVFGLFRYCVLTQEATYLCNKLDLKIEHQPSYPLFHLTMEDVWVWDKNRPSRIIPRADVHTTQDVTIEELKPDGGVPTTLPPDFNAAARDRVAAGMLLAVDVGNTQTVLGLFDGERLRREWRLTTHSRRTADELELELVALLQRHGLGTHDVDAACLSSTVPPLMQPWTDALQRVAAPSRSWSARACAPACPCAPTTRTRSAPTAS